MVHQASSLNNKINQGLMKDLFPKVRNLIKKSPFPPHLYGPNLDLACVIIFDDEATKENST